MWCCCCCTMVQNRRVSKVLHHLPRWGCQNNSYITYIVMFCMFFCTFIVITDFISKYFFKKDCNKFKIFQVNHFSSQSESSNSTFFFFFFQALLKFLPIFSIFLFSPILNYFQWFFKMFSKFVSLINV